jgi:hypothetical protein
MGGSRLTRFMETVQAATSEIPAAVQAEAQEAVEARRELAAPKPERKTDVSAQPAVLAADPWTGLLQAGMGLVQQMVDASRAGPSKDGMVRRDERTGESYLRLPVPSPEVVEQAIQMVSTLLQSLRPTRGN